MNGRPRSSDAGAVVALLGGSTAYGWGIRDAETIAAYLEDRLPATSVVNAGFPGLTTLDTLLVYERKVRPLHPSVVVILTGLNDLYYAIDWTTTSARGWLNSVYEVRLRAHREPELSPVVRAIERIALRNCYACYYTSTLVGRLYDETGAAPVREAATVVGMQPIGAPNERAMELTAWSLAELARRTRADGGCLVVAWQPMVGLNSRRDAPDAREAARQSETRAPGWTTIAGKMLDTLRAKARPLLEAAEAVDLDLGTTLDQAQVPVFDSDGVHYTPTGNQLMAAALEPAIREGCKLTPVSSDLKGSTVSVRRASR